MTIGKDRNKDRLKNDSFAVFETPVLWRQSDQAHAKLRFAATKLTQNLALPTRASIWGAKMFDFRRITLFCLEKRLSKHKMTIFS